MFTFRANLGNSSLRTVSALLLLIISPSVGNSLLAQPAYEELELANDIARDLLDLNRQLIVIQGSDGPDSEIAFTVSGIASSLSESIGTAYAATFVFYQFRCDDGRETAKEYLAAQYGLVLHRVAWAQDGVRSMRRFARTSALQDALDTLSSLAARAERFFRPYAE